MHCISCRKKGFTLIELSIVLVIIGLLVGGILTAQSLISAAKINSFVQQLGQFDTAVSNFESSFDSLPGDTNKYPCTTITNGTTAIYCISGVSGNGNGFITDDDGAANNFFGEVQHFWNQLSVMGLKPNNGSGTYSNNYRPAGIEFTGTNANTPQAKIGKNLAVIAYSYGTDYNSYNVMDCSEMTSETLGADACTAGVDGIDALSIDSKIDDASSDSGNMKAWEGSTRYLGYNATTFSVNYNPQNLYSLQVRIGSASKNLK
jgi:prepilin-type N-terminal cleavage/methylation domain-containing protein